ncbi:hypothetical protein D1007_13724 [Hordeum vulgare]|nr:hypothetical protein D1007_13724 [Hordeum vulgare]
MDASVLLAGPKSVSLVATESAHSNAPGLVSAPIYVEEVIAFGGVLDPMTTDRRSCQRVQAQPDVDDLQMGRAMRAAKMKVVQNSTGMSINAEHSILHFTPHEILDKAGSVGVTLGNTSKEVSKSINDLLDLEVDRALDIIRNLAAVQAMNHADITKMGGLNLLCENLFPADALEEGHEVTLENNNADDGSDQEDESTETERGIAANGKPVLDEVILLPIAKAQKGQFSNSMPTKNRTPLVDAFAGMERDSVDMHIMMFLCANGIPFNVLRSLQYIEMVAAIQKAPKGYKPPSYEKARTALLDACKRKVEADLALVRKTWYSNCVSVVSDDWTNVKGKPLINVIASNSRGSMFMYAQDFSGIEKTGPAIAKILLEAIDEIGPANVLQVLTDNASNYGLVGKEITDVHKHILWSPCVVHTLNLIFKDLADTYPWMVETCEEGKAIGSYFRDHQHCQALFRDNSQLDLLRVAKTRFASNYIVLRRLSDDREALATTVVTTRWKDLLKACDTQGRAKATAIAQSINSERFWENVDAFLAMTKPLFMVIKFSNGEGPKIGDVYERMDNMLGEIQDVVTKEDNPRKEDWPKISEIVIERWGKMN